MSPLELSIDTLEPAQERFLETLDQMTVEEANTMPKPLIKSVTWLIWHSSRVLDYQISPLAGLPQLYETAGFKERFNLDLPDDTQDWRHTPQEAAKVVVSDKQVLKDYLQASMERTKAYFAQLDEADLADVIDRNWTPAVTRGVRIVSTVDDIVMHSGQAVYSRRLVIGK
ncbi:DinB family protein [Streptococcus sobrinus]|uniref:DinB family protein n=1 Tax=Streptococcus sobrinus TaxID=1310 RepID=UPI0002DE9A87|nr:DinB family protein [Streptococcus sobrinus]AWN61406.1 DinB family protein [Streptococcus sobrinus]AWN63279.1 DinB family protein [Streptococcus sobrinus]SQG19671.1 DinB superfamily [Streptococcus sobrinus]